MLPSLLSISFSLPTTHLLLPSSSNGDCSCCDGGAGGEGGAYGTKSCLGFRIWGFSWSHLTMVSLLIPPHLIRVSPTSKVLNLRGEKLELSLIDIAEKEFFLDLFRLFIFHHHNQANVYFIPQQVVEDFKLEMFDRHKNHVKKGVEVGFFKNIALFTGGD
ncbi:uncharacterized protein [Spinacia oleracea]|uniref:Uncharacterized protein n=1 Tax=Spinacia oleracea TaxID=3562 RepID=A0ABM3QP30_SPIOL|nr:uncharacterized protein LOC110774805 [Spinacia oleracea]XP_056685124.1 uncharacterized protein LOC110774805 [Spinacia oleracea]